MAPYASKKDLYLDNLLGTLVGYMSSHSSDCVEITPIAKDLSSFVDLERLTWELSPTTSEHVLPSKSRDRGVFISELGCKIRSVNQLTSQQFTNLID